jgi:DNA-binding transcriptional ArsR family regulator
VAAAALDSVVLDAVASPRRREILRLIWRNPLPAGQIHAAMPDVSFPAVSLHLAKLSQAGLVDVQVDGRQRVYAAKRDACGPLGKSLERMWDDALWRLKLLAELEYSRRGPRPRRTSRTR